MITHSHVQIVEYRPAAGDGPAQLVLADAGSIQPIDLRAGERIDYALGSRRCAGVIDATAHRSCDRPGVPWCDAHAETWICARCTGTCLKDEMDCHEDHAVYLAAFAPDIVKVGVTREWRLETRLREQGADRAAHIRTVPDGRIAREIEAGIATDYTDSVRIDRKLAGLHRSVDPDWWRSTLDPFAVIDTVAFDYGLELADRPVRETMATGRIVGTKGRILVLERAGTTFAVDMRDLVGYTVESGVTDERAVQSSLGVFE